MRAFQLLPVFFILCGGAAFSAMAQATPEIDPVGEEAYQMLASFYEYDAEIPLEARVVEKLEDKEEGIPTIRRKIVFRSVRGYLVPGYLEIPKSGSASYPCVLLMHGWSGGKQNWWEDDNYISGGNVRKALLKAGFAVFALDAQGHGDRIAENDYSVVNRYSGPDEPPAKNYYTTREVIMQTVVDYRRGLDYLASRDDIDASRIGALGYSMGGAHAVMLTALEPRIKAAVGVVVPAWAEKFSGMAPMNYARGIVDRPFLMVQGTTDELCSEAQANAIFVLIPSPKKEIVFYKAGHRLPAKYVKQAVTWLVERL